MGGVCPREVRVGNGRVPVCTQEVVGGGDGRPALPQRREGAGGTGPAPREGGGRGNGGGSPFAPSVRRAASTWLPHQQPLWQAAPNADGADVSAMVPSFSPVNSANFNPEG